jgi:hypothetical protein
MSKRKNKEPSQPPEPPLGQVLNDFMIDMKVAELRNTVSMFEGRISDLLGQKGNPVSLRMPAMDLAQAIEPKIRRAGYVRDR